LRATALPLTTTSTGTAFNATGNGTVSYSADFQIIRPIDLSKGNHRILFDLPNRGSPLALSTFNDSRPANNTASSGIAGNGFLMRRGYTVAWPGWEGALLPGNGPASRGLTGARARTRPRRQPERRPGVRCCRRSGLGGRRRGRRRARAGTAVDRAAGASLRHAPAPTRRGDRADLSYKP